LRFEVGALEHDLQPVNLLLLREIADQHLRFGVEVVRDDVEVAVVVEIENDGLPNLPAKPWRRFC
jgi:hypothetical protein